jgi:hypothetical protein
MFAFLAYLRFEKQIRQSDTKTKIIPVDFLQFTFLLSYFSTLLISTRIGAIVRLSQLKIQLVNVNTVAKTSIYSSLVR